MLKDVFDLDGLDAVLVGHVFSTKVLPKLTVLVDYCRWLRWERELSDDSHFARRPVEGVDTRPILPVFDCCASNLDQV